MKIIETGILIFISLLVYSCKSGTTEAVSLEFEQRTFDKEACVGEDCAKISLSYPFFTGSSESADFLNVHVDQQMVMFLNIGENQEIVPLDSAVKAFLDSYVAFKKDFDSPQEWEISVDSKVTLHGKALVSLVFNSFSFTGGAHPNTYRMYLNFDLTKNAPIKNEDLILDKKGLLTLAEAKFKDYHDVPDSVSLEKDGSFFLANDKDFFLPAAMGFEGEEFVLFFNPYEIGPYVMGSTELRFTREEIRSLVIIP
ncbi:DUF3298 and DUF4163 domain-containing protein [Cognataquiflexum aquatile]|uniref:DUF3298 and DUF4163 domain-containing protein n=1 Tax=Cognataquiflexum aquatile TaxID=2249427 RepID=UPI000DEA12F0|nr:DUF3298 and DUF4163 domain-containing protein [Cognataquiflexum aquatile]